MRKRTDTNSQSPDVNRGSASGYFEELFRTLRGVQATDRQGAGLAIDEAISRAAGMLLEIQGGSGRPQSKVMLVGNGTSAAIASQAQGHLCKLLGRRAMVFNEAPLLTALSNDLDYVRAFEQCVRLWSDPGDLLVAISGSGRSRNILRAVEAAIGLGSTVITLSGSEPGNPLRQLGDINFYAPSANSGVVEIVANVILRCASEQAIRCSGT